MCSNAELKKQNWAYRVMHANSFSIGRDFQSVTWLWTGLYPLKVSSVGHHTQVFNIRICHIDSF